jgi:hypothetical protein
MWFSPNNELLYLWTATFGMVGDSLLGSASFLRSGGTSCGLTAHGISGIFGNCDRVDGE